MMQRGDSQIELQNNVSPWIPFYVLCWYVLITFSLSLVGPVYSEFYTTTRKILVFSFMLCVMITSWLFTSLAEKQQRNSYLIDKQLKQVTILRIVEIAILFALLIKVILLFSFLQNQGLPDIAGKSVFESFARFYSAKKLAEFETNIFRQADSLTKFVYYFALCSGILRFKKLPIYYKVGFAVMVIVDFIYNWFFVSTMRGISTSFFAIGLFMAVKTYRKNKIISIKAILVVTFVGLLSFVALMSILGARTDLWKWDPNRQNINAYMSINQQSLLIKLLPLNMRMPIALVVSYISQGYFGLGVCLTTPFEWTYGLGASRGLNSILNQVFPGIPIVLNSTYPLRAQEIYGYNGLKVWHTMFPWLAGDLTFAGTLVYMGISAYILAICWVESIDKDNPLSFTVLFLITIQYLFMTANNQLFINRGESVAVVVIFVAWLIFHKRMNLNNSRIDV